MIKISILQKRVYLYIHNVNIKRKLGAKNIAPLIDKILSLPNIGQINTIIKDIIHIDSTSITNNQKEQIFSLLDELKPWRKGPFSIFKKEVQSEWDSSIKFNLIKNHLNIKDKVVADIGCNNGYYMFRMLPFAPKEIIGFEPSAMCKMQFDFINHFIKSDISFELLGIEDLPNYDKKFDFIICLGVLYHRTNPIDCLKMLKNSLNKDGEIIIDSIIIDSSDELVLSPLSYAKMKNVYFIPSIKALSNWLIRAGFKNIEIISIKKTDLNEQKKTEWIYGESLESFLDSKDNNKTIEGYNAPIRAYIKGNI